MLRFIASAARPLKNDPALTPLGAFDILQRIHRKYEGYWISIWLVCMDGFGDIVPTTPLQNAIELIEKHGGFAGIVGCAIVARQFTFLKKPLKKGKKVEEILDANGDIAADILLKRLEPAAFEKRKLREQMQDKTKHS